MQVAAAAVQDELVAVTARLQSAQQALQVEQVGSPLQVAVKFDCNAVQCTGAESSGAQARGVPRHSMYQRCCAIPGIRLC